MSETTLLTVLNKSVEYLEKKGIKQARLDTQIILSNALNISRIELYTQFERPLNSRELNDLRIKIVRRSQGEPVQRILGETHFRYGIFKTDERCLVPRRETEILVDFTLEEISKKKNPLVLEIGVGSGAIVLSVLKECSQDIIMDACDIQLQSLAITQENALQNEVKITGTLCQSDLFSGFSLEKKWDIIVSNPPYLSQAEYENIDQEVKDWDPKVALVGGVKGLECLEKIISQAFERLNEQGVLLLEIGLEQSQLLVKYAQSCGFENVVVKKDYADIERFLLISKNEKCEKLIG